MIWVFFCQSSHSFVFTIGTCNFFPDSVVVDTSFTHLRQVGFIVQNCLNMQGLLHSVELPGTCRVCYNVQNFILQCQLEFQSQQRPYLYFVLNKQRIPRSVSWKYEGKRCGGGRVVPCGEKGEML